MATNTFAGFMSRKPKYLLAFFLCCCNYLVLKGQDSLVVRGSNDSLVSKPRVLDSATLKPAMDSTKAVIADLSRFPAGDKSNIYGNMVGSYIDAHPYLKVNAPSVRMQSLVRTPQDTDWIFYLFAASLIYLALIRLSFPKYFYDLFRVFFNTSLRQKQIKEQLIQEPFPSLMLNIFFFFSGGIFLYFLARHYGYTKSYSPLLALGFCILMLIAIYFVKYLVLQFMGWIFGKQYEAEIYAFVVFMVNKIAGLVLLPLAIILAFSNPDEIEPVIATGLFILFILLVYRLIRAYSAIYKSLKINQLHFILFVFAFELVPILLLYKVLNNLL